MQQKDGSGMSKTPKKLTPITAFLAGIIRSSKMNKMMNLGGQIGGAQVFTGAPGKGSGFKQNQRKVGKTEFGFVVDMHRIELNQLTGHFYSSHKYAIGEELKIDKLFGQLEVLKNQDKEVKKIAHALKTAAGVLEKIDPIFHKKAQGNHGK